MLDTLREWLEVGPVTDELKVARDQNLLNEMITNTRNNISPH